MNFSVLKQLLWHENWKNISKNQTNCGYAIWFFYCHLPGTLFYRILGTHFSYAPSVLITSHPFGSFQKRLSFLRQQTISYINKWSHWRFSWHWISIQYLYLLVEPMSDYISDASRPRHRFLLCVRRWKVCAMCVYALVCTCVHLNWNLMNTKWTDWKGFECALSRISKKDMILSLAHFIDSGMRRTVFNVHSA